jgi:small subunit ribosomal protein S2
MVQLEQMDESGALEALPKKEASHLRTELAKLRRNLDGIRNMNTLPSAVFIVDTKREEIAVAEARRLSIPIIGLVDTNADPDDVDFVIPGNDDAIRAVNLMTTVIADAVAEGRAKLEGEQNAPAPQPAAAAPETAAPQDAPAEPLAAEAAADVVAPEEPVAVEAQAPMDAEVSADVVAEA